MQLRTILAGLFGLAVAFNGWTADAPVKKSPVQEMMELAEKASAQVDAPAKPKPALRTPAAAAAASASASSSASASASNAASTPAARPTSLSRAVVAPLKKNVPALAPARSEPVSIIEGTAGAPKLTVAPPAPPMPAPHEPPASASVPAPANQAAAAKGLAAIPSTGLPGLGTPPGAALAPAKPVTLQAQNGVNEFVTVSQRMPNRIATPFAHPKIVDFSSTDYQTVGTDVYVVPKGKEPIGLFIRDGDRLDSPTVALTLVPRDIPGVTILVNIDGAYRAGDKAGKAQAEEEQETSSYEDMLRKYMRQLVQDRPVSGYTETPLEVGAATMGALRIVPEKEWSGQSYDMFRYRIVNTSGEPVELSEESFYRKGIKAISLYPSPRIDPWQTTKIFIITGKSEGADER